MDTPYLSPAKGIHKAIHFLSFVALLCCGFLASAQHYPQHYFTAPMDTPLYLSAPFGSLRENHFHSGMDIRTYEREGLPVYAAADGYVSRIKVSATGYGKAVYIDHPNGYTTVYGHLLKYEGELASYVRKYHYETESFEFDHFPGRDRIKIAKGQIISWSGNSGGSTGPHLHFEIRDTKSEEPLNPQLFGIRGTDTIAPELIRLVFYDLSANKPFVTGRINLNNVALFDTDSGLVVRDTVILPSALIGTGIDGFDYLTRKDQEYSIYCAEVYADQRKIFSFRLDRINFEDTRFVNAHIDYERYKSDGRRIQKCFIDDGNRMPIYNYVRNKGRIYLDDKSVHLLRFCVGDFAGRYQTVHMWVKYVKSNLYPETPCSEITFLPGKDNSYQTSGFKVFVPARSLYDTLYPCFDMLPLKSKSFLSPVYQVHVPVIPLHRSISISIKSDSVSYYKKLLIATVNKDGSFKAAGGDFSNGWVTYKTTTFGNYTVIADSVPPEIRLMNIGKKDEVRDTCFMIRITDQLSGIGSYKGTLNGKWILLDYDAKDDKLRYFTDDLTIFNQKQNLVITVTDKKGNISQVSRDIVFIK